MTTNCLRVLFTFLITWFIGVSLQSKRLPQALSYENSVFLFETDKPLSVEEIQKAQLIPGVHKVELYSSYFDRPFFKKFYRIETSLPIDAVIPNVEKL
ncbi:MAG: hypothetical protein R2827_11585 [Bdellovibrionales bacterium]